MYILIIYLLGVVQVEYLPAVGVVQNEGLVQLSELILGVRQGHLCAVSVHQLGLVALSAQSAHERLQPVRHGHLDPVLGDDHLQVEGRLQAEETSLEGNVEDAGDGVGRFEATSVHLMQEYFTVLDFAFVICKWSAVEEEDDEEDK